MWLQRRYNPITIKEVSIPLSQRVVLEVYNLLGQKVAVLQDGMLNVGTHSVNFDGRRLGSGVYLYRMTAGSIVLTQKMTLIK